MKHIQKRGRPPQYARWCASVAGSNKEDFREIPSAEKNALLKALIGEQGGLCAYTMRRIEDTASHVEHIKPQSRCRAELRGTDLDYRNLVACFPRDGMLRRCCYGAQEKRDWWKTTAPLSFLHSTLSVSSAFVSISMARLPLSVTIRTPLPRLRCLPSITLALRKIGSGLSSSSFTGRTETLRSLLPKLTRLRRSSAPQVRAGSSASFASQFVVPWRSI